MNRMAELRERCGGRVAGNAFFQEGLNRTCLPGFSRERIFFPVAAEYTFARYAKGQVYKVSCSMEAAEHANTDFHDLPENFQQGLARLAELNLLATASVFSREGVKALVNFGACLTPAVTENTQAVLRAQSACGEKLQIPELESHMTKHSYGEAPNLSWTEILARLHHSVWHANLEERHDFAFSYNNLPVENVGSVSGNVFTPNLREHVMLSNSIAVLADVRALYLTLQRCAETPLVAAVNHSQKYSESRLLRHGWRDILLNLDCNAVINN